MLEILNEGQWGNHVCAIHLLKHIQWIVQQVRLWAWTKEACIIYKRIQPTSFLRCLHQCMTMPGIGYIAGNSNYPRLLREFRTYSFKSIRAASIDDELPASGSELAW